MAIGGLSRPGINPEVSDRHRIASTSNIAQRLLTQRALTYFAAEVAAAMTTVQNPGTGHAAEHYLVIEGVALESAIMTTRKNATTILMATTSKTKPPVRLGDGNRPPVVGACDWKPVVEIKPALRSQEVDDWSPQNVTPNTYLGRLGSCQCDGVAEEVQASASPGKGND